MTDLGRSLSHIDMVALVSNDLGQPRKQSGRWFFWLCPFHAEKSPSLGVNRENGSWYCYGCSQGGDAINWLRTYRKMGFKEALATLGLNASGHQEGKVQAGPLVDPGTERGKESAPPPAIWQKRGLEFLEYARNQLWESPYALAYLHEQRGLQDETIRHFGLGYNPEVVRDFPVEKWGFPKDDEERVWLPKGFVIPCWVEKSLWYIKIRQVEDDPKYVHVRGSSPALFGTDTLLGTPLILLTEGEFDCMLAWQVLRDVAGVATLGSANKKLDLNRWLRYLLPAEEIIAVLDNDAAGKLGAQRLAYLSSQIHSVRIPSLTPSGKDITDYILAGGDLWEWLKHHLEKLEGRE